MQENPQVSTFDQILCSDIRFSLPDTLDDQSWELGAGISQPTALSIFTTYGLRANRMHIYPVFSLEDQSVQSPLDFHSPPSLSFFSTNFASIKFSPFPAIDVIFKVWVPNSHVLCGEITCSNLDPSIKTLGMDWLIHLSPLQGGSPMKPQTIGLNTVLQGECGNLFPVFYLTGGAYPSMSPFPGLGTKLLLMPTGSKTSNWVLASLTSIDSSFQQARQYSSRVFETEQLKIEMADKREKVVLPSQNTLITGAIDVSQVRAFQMVVPAIQKFKQPAYVSARDPNTGFYPRADILEIFPEWTGQTLTEIGSLSQVLLPGRPEVIKGFLQNFVSQQRPNGRIDTRISPNGMYTGHSSLPIFAQLVADLYPYLEDKPWLEEIFPHLIQFLKTWVNLSESGVLEVAELTHPVQLNFNYPDTMTAIRFTDHWISLKSSTNVLLLGLLFKETNDLLQISRWLEKENDSAWLENIHVHLKNEIDRLWDEGLGSYRSPDHVSSCTYPGRLISSFSRNGTRKPRAIFQNPGRIYLRLVSEERVPPNFTIRIKGTSTTDPVELTIKVEHLQNLGNVWVFISNQAFSSIREIQIQNMPASCRGEIGLADLERVDLTQLVALYAGCLSRQQVDKLLGKINITAHLGDQGLSLVNYSIDHQPVILPDYLAGMIIDGLLRYDRVDLAELVFKHHFIDHITTHENQTASIKMTSIAKLDDLVPLRLFLRIIGIRRLTGKEVIFSHFHKQKNDSITVKYNKIEMILKQNVIEIHTQTGEVIYLDQGGPNRVILE